MHRQLANLIKQGNIAEVNPAECRVRVAHGGLTTDWLPYFVPFAGGVSVHRPPSVGENCIVLSPSGETANGVVLCGLMSSQFASPSNTEDNTVVQFPDGATVDYNHASGSLKIENVKTVLIQAAESLTIDCPQTTVKGALTVEQLFTYQSGMVGGNGGGGAAATISGSLTHTGGELSSNGVVLHTHTHTGDSGGRTGTPS